MLARQRTRPWDMQLEPPAAGLDGEDTATVLEWTAFLYTMFWDKNMEVVLKQLAIEEGKGEVGEF